MGGFSGSVPEPTLARVQQLVATGQLRFFLLGGTGGFGGPGRGGAGGTAAQVASWVESACAVVPARITEPPRVAPARLRMRLARLMP